MTTILKGIAVPQCRASCGWGIVKRACHGAATRVRPLLAALKALVAGMPAALADAATVTSLYSFGGPSGAPTDAANVIQGSDGNFYGTTYRGGVSGPGTVFKITSSGVGPI